MTAVVPAEQIGRQHLGANVFFRFPDGDIELGITGTLREIAHTQELVVLTVEEDNGATTAWELALDHEVRVQ